MKKEKKRRNHTQHFIKTDESTAALANVGWGWGHTTYLSMAHGFSTQFLVLYIPSSMKKQCDLYKDVSLDFL